MAIVKNICTNQKAYRLAAMILEVPAIAEGVETLEQINLLKYRLRYFQGYYFSKPLPVNEFEKKL